MNTNQSINTKIKTETDNAMNVLLREFKKESNHEDITIKDIVKRQLLSDKRILHALNVKGLSVDSPRDYYGKYILPYYIVPDTQTEDNNYICYDTSFETLAKGNDTIKLQYITFYVLCNSRSGIIDKQTDIARHDLIGSLLIDAFNYSNMFGTQVKLISDKSRPVDNHFCARTLVFEQQTLNSAVKNGAYINKMGNY